jgi:hypothetical protein
VGRTHNVLMHKLRWDEVKTWFDPCQNGSVPDLVVAGTSLSDWADLLTLVRSQGWRREYVVGDDRVELPGSAADLFAADPVGAVSIPRCK